jgi:hypothetical protein
MTACAQSALARKPTTSSPRPGARALQRSAVKSACECEKCANKGGVLQRAAVQEHVPAQVPDIVYDVLKSSGQPLDRDTREFMEQRFNHDFSAVRVHTDARAAESARAVNARAYTVGSHIAFSGSAYEPGENGRRLLAHELAHVVQQKHDVSSMELGLELGSPESDAESEAVEASRRVAGESVAISSATGRQIVRRELDGNISIAGVGNGKAGKHRATRQGVARSASLGHKLESCTSKAESSGIVSQHSIQGGVIRGPGNKAKITVMFSCRPRSFFSEIADAAGKVVKSEQFSIHSSPPNKLALSETGEWSVQWDGKMKFADNSYLAPDGKYVHRISSLAYAPGPSADLKIEGVVSSSPEIKVDLRGGVMRGRGKRKSRHLYNLDGSENKNSNKLAKAMAGEARGTSVNELAAVGWAIRNEMIAINSYDVDQARKAFNFKPAATASQAVEKLAHTILASDISSDVTSGAIKWYSPKSMPPNFGKCNTEGGMADCSGGRVDLKKPGKWSYAPGFHKTMTYAEVAGVEEWNFRFYKL